MIRTMRELTKKAFAKKYALSAFDCPNVELMLAAKEAAEAIKSPVVIMATEKDIEHAGGFEVLRSMFEGVAKQAKVPMALHLDHGRTFEVIEGAILAGFPSVMVDASLLPYEENLALTKRVVKLARKHKVFVQAELGSLLEHEFAKKKNLKATDIKKLYTHPDAAADFVKQTGVDTLAVAIGNLHGAIKYQIRNPRLDFARLKEIHKKVRIPLVMHGSSEISKDNLKKIVKNGVATFNFRTDYFSEFAKTVAKTSQKEKDPRVFLSKAQKKAAKIMQQKMVILGSKNKA